jgi:pimeloyl-ACP methyl ester carboxylesterase
MAPAVDALARRCRVITFSLADEPSAEWPSRGTGFDAYVEQVAQALDACGLERAVICGVSYGGLVAAAFAKRYPHRVAGLALVSAIPPSWRPDARAAFFMRSPNLLLPLFLLGSLRLYPEIAAAHGGWWSGVWPSIRQGARSLAHFPACDFSTEEGCRRVLELAGDTVLKGRLPNSAANALAKLASVGLKAAELGVAKKIAEIERTVKEREQGKKRR